MKKEKIQIKHSDWIKQGEDLFGKDFVNWKFKCPSCGYVASGQEYKDAGAPATAVGFSCVGRWGGSKKEMFDKTGGPCNYAGGGLFGLNPVDIEFEDGEIGQAFEFAT